VGRFLLTLVAVVWIERTVHPGAHSGPVPSCTYRAGDERPHAAAAGRSRWGNRSAVDKPIALTWG
jgi:hypothetical protein